ncbi:MAG TPA: hypothetical protein VMF06_25285 [Candidatus Limnocylindria bacterium]|jgi:hypothetical protein|nr:hypothetical protein [Candidatus Limnocylindria bacterium]
MKLNSTINSIATSALFASATVMAADDWTGHAIAPVANPIFFESPLIQNEVRPIFAWHRTDEGFLGVPTDVRVYALQLRYAVTERLAIIATKDGYIEIEPKGVKKSSGWGDLAAGLKYAIYKNDAQQAVITPGVTFTLPTGSHQVFQGYGSGEANIFVSATKGWNDFHATANVGFRVPIDGDKGTSSVHYSGMLDYYACRWFIPFVSANAFTTVSDAKRVPFNTEGFDLINFGSSNASGTTQGAIGGGFRSRLTDSLDLGFAYEYGVIGSNDIFKDRFTVDLTWRF